MKSTVYAHLENDYRFYRLPLFKATAVKYGWNNPIGEDSGREKKNIIHSIKQIYYEHKQIHKVRKFYLSRNPDKMMMLEERKAVIKERNKGLSPEYDKEYYCGTCGAKDGAEHPKTGYCFHCDTDNWIPKND